MPTPTLFVAMLAASLVAPAALAATPDATKDLVAIPTCRDFLVGLEVADPGRNPTKERAADAKNAQDDLFSALLWVHGYQSGRRPEGSPRTAMTQAWVIAEIGRVKAACEARSPDGSMLLVDIAEQL
jgi:hypothetical protein